ncbi:MAG TPA: N-acetylglucosamine-6-phosphate deacetylase [Firmicutes bacterium]|nr:N-acetylglucosamine-6-phosphate deacetylase [Bacillota bacterium]
MGRVPSNIPYSLLILREDLTLNQAIVLTNGRVITPFREINRGSILIEGGLIKDVGPVDAVKIPEGARVIDVKGSYISPGFIDLHIHGAWGGDVMAASPESLEKMAEGLVKCGTTAFLPTTLAAPLKDIVKAIDCVDQAMKRGTRGARILGVHMEGPYFSLEQKGAQNPRYIVHPRPEDYIPILDKYPCVVRVSAAPEIPGGFELGQELRRRGIVASIGHSDAKYQDVIRAVECGYSHVTHIFSGMSGLRRVNAYRVSGVIESTLLIDELTTEMIADGHHLPPSLMQLVLRTKGLDKVCVVSDSMAAAGLGPGQFDLGGLDVIIEADIPEVFEVPAQEGNYVAKLTDRSSFASSVATMDQLVRNMVKVVGLNVLDAVKLATFNPARMQRVDHRMGILTKGMEADIAVFDEDVNVQLTIVAGRVVYDRTGTRAVHHSVETGRIVEC